MKITTLLLVNFLFIGVCAQAQSNPITKFDVYGRWVLELEEDNQLQEKLLYLRRSESEVIESLNWTDISLLAYNQCEFNSSSEMTLGFCSTETVSSRYKTSWDYNEDRGVVTITTLDIIFKELNVLYPEEYAEFGSPEWITKIEYEVIVLPWDKIGLLNMATNL